MVRRYKVVYRPKMCMWSYVSTHGGHAVKGEHVAVGPMVKRSNVNRWSVVVKRSNPGRPSEFQPSLTRVFGRRRRRNCGAACRGLVPLQPQQVHLLLHVLHFEVQPRDLHSEVFVLHRQSWCHGWRCSRLGDTCSESGAELFLQRRKRLVGDSEFHDLLGGE